MSFSPWEEWMLRSMVASTYREQTQVNLVQKAKGVQWKWATGKGRRGSTKFSGNDVWTDSSPMQKKQQGTLRRADPQEGWRGAGEESGKGQTG